MDPQELPSQPRNGKPSLWVSQLMTFLSLTTFSVGAAIWVTILVIYFQMSASDIRGFQELGPPFTYAIGLGACIVAIALLITSSIGTVLALVGLLCEMVARKHFHKRLAISLMLNASTGLIPFLCFWMLTNH